MIGFQDFIAAGDFLLSGFTAAGDFFSPTATRDWILLPQVMGYP